MGLLFLCAVALAQDWNSFFIEAGTITAIDSPNPTGQTFIPAPPLHSQPGSIQVQIPVSKLRNLPMDVRFSIKGIDKERLVGETVLPPNNLRIGPNQGLLPGGITETEFNAVIDQIASLYIPFAQRYGATLTIEKHWLSPVVNAFAAQSANTWIVSMFGGLARHSRMTLDGLAWVVCHEMGHHFGGFPFYPGGGTGSEGGLSWASAEGQADYYATQTCLRTFWNSDISGNLNAVLNPNPNADYWTVIAKCSYVYQNYPANEQALCVRSALAAKSLADIDAELTNRPYPEYRFPSNWNGSPIQHRNPNVSSTSFYHPPSQCRLDTAFSASVCTVLPTTAHYRGFIPGRGLPEHLGGNNGLVAEREAAGAACAHQFGDASDSRLPHYGSPPLHFGPWGYRPRCWFKSSPNVRGPFLAF